MGDGREMRSKYRLGHGRIISAICKKCGRYYYCDENYHRGICDVCSSSMMRKGKHDRTKKKRTITKAP